eukprot:TRINITY_DN841_c0_g1_i1.p1 TRINITY_DN841_c0_g1~~TRINITY_DN841_c0_g1_i1.p1  ORF type:complete len:1154 (-),score=289.59 TRINITY_DN841_c0_g1_i1:304-3765(-)
MVLGLRTKNRKGASIQVNYIIHVHEIKPWPPSQSLKSLRSVVLQWENGDRSSGSLNPVVPSIGSGVGDGKIEFNESFKLTTTLCREASAKGGNADVFLKNCLELNLYEPRRDKTTVKGQPLGGVIIDLSDHGIIKETVILSVPMNCKRSFRNTTQPVLYVKIQPFDKDSTSTSSRESLSKQVSLEKDGKESVSALMNEEYADEAEIASFTDDDVSSHSSLTISSSAFEPRTDSPAQNDTMNVRQLQEKYKLEAAKESTGDVNGVHDLPLESVSANSAEKPESLSTANASNQDFTHQNGSSSRLSSVDLSTGPMSPENDKTSPNSERTLTMSPKKSVTQSKSSSSSIAYEDVEEEVRCTNKIRSVERDNLAVEVLERDVDSKIEAKEAARNPVIEETNTSGIMQSSNRDPKVEEKPNLTNAAESEVSEDGKVKSWRQRRNGSAEGAYTNGRHQVIMEEMAENKHVVNEHTGNLLEDEPHSTEIEDMIHYSPGNSSHTSVANSEETQVNQQGRISQDSYKKLSAGDPLSLSRRGLGVKGNSFSNDRLQHMKFSLRSSQDLAGGIAYVNDNHYMEEDEEEKEINMLENARYGSRRIITNIAKEIRESRSFASEKAKSVSKETHNSSSDTKIRQLERRIKTLEAELRESAAVELGLYSIVAEHGSSVQKVHAPARRLSRLYLHASKQGSRERRAGAARTAVSGLVLVAKACGNDVPRLTFWLSNSVVLRAIITEAAGDLHQPVSAGPHIEINGVAKRAESKLSSLKWGPGPNKKEQKFAINVDDWEDPQTFTTALEKIEAWIFSRIIESVWWQTLTPHMQSATQVGSEDKLGSFSRISYGKKPSMSEQQQGNFSINHWKKAFKDACERICPVRAGGHECGCLPMLARLVMEQCVARLDVAMFNAILRESDDEMPTDPVSDPISDPRVLPIPAGKSSFGAGAQLKNVIGNWSRWLTDLFGIDDDDSFIDGNESDDERQDSAASFKSFLLLNALSDLLMLPKDMLLDGSVRREVCPTFGAPLIKRVLSSFVPDEFCPDPIPEIVLEALDLEDPLEVNEESIRHFPCDASPLHYSPPSATSVSTIIGDLGSHSQLRRSRSSVLRKCQTSDDELDELDSPLTSILIDGIRASPTSTADWRAKESNGLKAFRYQLLREVWRD